MTTKFRYCELFKTTLKSHPGVIEAFKKFVQLKSADPMAQYGAKDRHFSGEGNLPGYIHAGLTNDISLIYKRSGKNPTIIDLYAVLSHDELGTGQPPNMKRQKSNSKQFGNQELVDMPTSPELQKKTK